MICIQKIYFSKNILLQKHPGALYKVYANHRDGLLNLIIMLKVLKYINLYHICGLSFRSRRWRKFIRRTFCLPQKRPLERSGITRLFRTSKHVGTDKCQQKPQPSTCVFGVRRKGLLPGKNVIWNVQFVNRFSVFRISRISKPARSSFN